MMTCLFVTCHFFVWASHFFVCFFLFLTKMFFQTEHTRHYTMATIPSWSTSGNSTLLVVSREEAGEIPFLQRLARGMTLQIFHQLFQWITTMWGGLAWHQKHNSFMGALVNIFNLDKTPCWQQLMPHYILSAPRLLMVQQQQQPISHHP